MRVLSSNTGRLESFWNQRHGQSCENSCWCQDSHLDSPPYPYTVLPTTSVTKRQGKEPYGSATSCLQEWPWARFPSDCGLTLKAHHLKTPRERNLAWHLSCSDLTCSHRYSHQKMSGEEKIQPQSTVLGVCNPGDSREILIGSSCNHSCSLPTKNMRAEWAVRRKALAFMPFPSINDCGVSEVQSLDGQTHDSATEESHDSRSYCIWAVSTNSHLTPWLLMPWSQHRAECAKGYCGSCYHLSPWGPEPPTLWIRVQVH